MAKTLNEIKQDYLRKTLQLEIRTRTISRELYLATQELRKFRKAKLQAAQHMNQWGKNYESSQTHLSRAVTHFERVSRLSEDDFDGDKIETDDGKVVALKRKEK